LVYAWGWSFFITEEQVIVYVNEVLFDSQQKYHLMEGECYALVWAFYIFGNSWITSFCSTN
jgi:hypothetical protein